MTDVQLKSKGLGGQLIINGIDLSSKVQAVTIQAYASDVTQVRVTLVPGAKIDTEIVGADVTIVESQPADAT